MNKYRIYGIEKKGDSAVDKTDENFDTYKEVVIKKITENDKIAYYQVTEKPSKVVTILTDILTTQIINDTDLDSIANHYLKCELEAQKTVDKLKVTIQDGALLIFINFDENIIILSKIDYFEILSEKNSWNRDKGVPVDPKIFKSALFTFDEKLTIQEIVLFDSTNSDAKYWTSNFLGLEPVSDAEKTTKKSLDSIERIIDRHTNKSKVDRVCLKNDTRTYFQKNDEFELKACLKFVFDDADVTDASLDLELMKKEIIEDFKKKQLSTKFEIIKKAVKKRMQQSFKINDYIYLSIKNIEGGKPTDFISTLNEAGKRYLKVLVEEKETFESFSTGND